MTDLQPVAIFLPSLEGGGAERAMLNLARGIRASGRAADVVVATSFGAYRDSLVDGTGIVDLGASRTSLALPALVRYLRKRRPAVLFSALDHGNLIALFAGRLAGTGVKVIPGLRNTRSEELASHRDLKDLAILGLSRFLYATASHVVAVSKGVAKDACQLLGLRSEQVVIIPNPVLTPELDQLAKAPVTHPWFQVGAPPVILACGRLTRQKDYPTLIRAFAQISRHRDCRLMILGEGEERASLQQLIARLGLASLVDLPGFDPNPFRYMARCAVFALSSRFEGSPNVLVQALACGVPVVSTDCRSGPREILEGEPMGRLVPVGHETALADAIDAFLVQRPSVVRQTGLERFDFRAAAAAYLSLVP